MYPLAKDDAIVCIVLVRPGSHTHPICPPPCVAPCQTLSTAQLLQPTAAVPDLAFASSPPNNLHTNFSGCCAHCSSTYCCVDSFQYPSSSQKSALHPHSTIATNHRAHTLRPVLRWPIQRFATVRPDTSSAIRCASSPPIFVPPLPVSAPNQLRLRQFCATPSLAPHLSSRAFKGPSADLPLGSQVFCCLHKDLRPIVECLRFPSLAIPPFAQPSATTAHATRAYVLRPQPRLLPGSPSGDSYHASFEDGRPQLVGLWHACSSRSPGYPRPSPKPAHHTV